MRIVLHPGFHKTGTTTVQHTLTANKRMLRRHVRVFMRKRIMPLCEAARAYSATRDPLDLVGFRYEVARLMERIDHEDPRPMLLASEDLAGHMPGRRQLTGYDATPDLMRAFAETTAEFLAKPPSLHFHFSTRSAEPWLRSCHTQHLRATGMEMDEKAYARQFRSSADLDGVVKAVRAAVAPHQVTSQSLEKASTSQFGPLSALLPHLDLPEPALDRLKILPPANISMPAEMKAEFLALNRSELTGAELRAAKKATRRRYRSNGG